MIEENAEVKNLEKFDFKDGKYTYKLKTHIEYGTKIISEFVLVEPKAKHIRMLPSNPITDDTLKILGAISGQADSVIDELSLSDVGVLSDFISAF